MGNERDQRLTPGDLCYVATLAAHVAVPPPHRPSSYVGCLGLSDAGKSRFTSLSITVCGCSSADLDLSRRPLRPSEKNHKRRRHQSAGFQSPPPPPKFASCHPCRSFCVVVVGHLAPFAPAPPSITFVVPFPRCNRSLRTFIPAALLLYATNLSRSRRRNCCPA